VFVQATILNISPQGSGIKEYTLTVVHSWLYRQFVQSRQIGMEVKYFWLLSANMKTKT